MAPYPETKAVIGGVLTDSPVVVDWVSGDDGFGFAGVGADRPHMAFRVAAAVLAPAEVRVVRRVDELGTRLLRMCGVFVDVASDDEAQALVRTVEGEWAVHPVPVVGNVGAEVDHGGASPELGMHHLAGLASCDEGRFEPERFSKESDCGGEVSVTQIRDRCQGPDL